MTYEEQDNLMKEIEQEGMGLNELQTVYLNRVCASFEIECDETPF